MKNTGLLLLVLLVIVSGCVSLTPEDQSTNSNDQHSPAQNDYTPTGQQEPVLQMDFWPEMIAACTGKTVNDTCELKSNETVVNGSCKLRHGGNLTCIPLNTGQRLGWTSGGNVTNPQEMGFMQGRLDACTGKSVNDTCELTMNETVINGICIGGRNGELTCFSPDFRRGPGPGMGGPQGQDQPVPVDEGDAGGIIDSMGGN